jgi:SHS2 domain-containing protein
MRTITLEATELDLLLYDWLSELIFRKDRDREVYVRTRVAIDGEGPCRLTAEVDGGALEPGRTELRADAKAVTFHQFALARADGGWRARVVVDI